MNICKYIFLALPIIWPGISGASPAPSLRARMALAGIDNPNEVSDFLNRLQKAVRVRDAKTVSGMVHYPINVLTTERGPLEIRSAGDLITQFDIIFDKDVSAVVLCQNFDKVGANAYGVAIGDGVLWIGLVQVNLAKIRVTPESLQRDIASRNNRGKWQLKITGIFGDHAKAEAGKCLSKIQELGR